MATVDNVWYIDAGNQSSTGYYAATAWAALTTKVCGALVRQAAAPSLGNERIFVCVASTSGTGATGASEPTWTVTRGAKNTDGTVTWQEATGIAALNGDLTNTPNWNIVKNTAVSLGQVITNVAGNLILICTTAGTAGNGSEPSWASFTNAGATTADNTATWTTLGASFSNWAAPHARMSNAFSANWGKAGNTFYVASESVESSSNNNQNAVTPTDSLALSRVLCVNKSNVPPTSANLTTGASIQTTGANRLDIGKGTAGWAYYQGIAFLAGDGSNSADINFLSSTAAALFFVNCSFTLTSSATSSFAAMSSGTVGSLLSFDNCTIAFGNASQKINMAGNASNMFRWKNSASALSGTVPTTLVTRPGMIHWTGVDLGFLTSATTLFATSDAGASGFVVLEDCKLGASVVTAVTPASLLEEMYLIRCDSANVAYRTEKYGYLGQQTTSTTIIRTGGASDGTTGISYLLASNANATWYLPFKATPFKIWNDTTATNVTVTIEGLQDPRISTSLPKNDEVWMEVSYLGSSSTPLGSQASGTKADILASGSALTASTQAWDTQATARQNSHAYNVGDMYKSSNNAGRVFVVTTAGTSAGSEPGGIASAVDGGAVTDGTAVVTAAVRFKQAVTLSTPQPGMKGYLQAAIKVGKASASGYYIDPLLTLS